MTEWEENALKLENQICFPLYAAARKITGLYSPYLKPLGLTYTQYIVLMVLWEHQSLTVGEIGKMLRLDNGTLTPLLKKMQNDGYITRTRSVRDERVVIINITDQGEAMKEKCRDIPFEVGNCVNIGVKKAKLLYEILYEIIDIQERNCDE